MTFDLQCTEYSSTEVHCDINHVNGTNDLMSAPGLLRQNASKASKIWIQESQLSRLNSKVFHYFHQLKEFMAVGSHINSIASGTFTNCATMEILDLRFNNITKLGKRQFEGLYNLLELHLLGNQITIIHPTAFHGMKHLHKLYLGKNHLKSLNSGVFGPLMNLQLLSLEANYFTFIKPNVFRGLRNLKILNLYRNRLESLDLHEMFKFVPRLTEIALYENEFACTTLEVYLNFLKKKGVTVVKSMQPAVQKKKKTFTNIDGIECLNLVDLEIKNAFGGNEKLFVNSHAGLNFLV